MIDVRNLIRQPAQTFSNLEIIKDVSMLKDGNIKFLIDEGVFDTFFVRKNSPYLFVFFSGARDPSKSKLPYFNRWSWAPQIPGSCLFVSDPTLYLDAEKLRLGWYVGSDKHDWMNSTIQLVRKVAQLLGVDDSKIIFYGSSGGGFAALKAVGLLNNGVAIAINPQTDILKYNKEPVNEFLSKSFHKVASEIPDNIKRERFSVFSGLARSKKAKFILLQNVQDISHYKKHYLPLCAYLGLDAEDKKIALNRYNTWLYDCESGHGPEPKELIPLLLSQALNLTDPKALKINKLVEKKLSIRRINSNRLSISTILPFISGKHGEQKIYGAADDVLLIDGDSFVLQNIDFKKLTLSQRKQLNNFSILEKNILTFEETGKKWLISGFVVRFIFYWDIYISNYELDAYEDLVKRLRFLAYIISLAQKGEIALVDEDFLRLERIFIKHLEQFFNEYRKKTDKVYLTKSDLEVIRNIVTDDFYRDFNEKLEEVLSFSPFYSTLGDLESYKLVNEQQRTYRYGFLICPINSKDNLDKSTKILMSKYWRKIELDSFYLYLHFETNLHSYSFGDNKVLIIGDIFVAHGKKSLHDTLKDYITEDDWGSIDNLSGRFVLIVKTNNTLKLFTDAFGARTTYYTIVENDIFISSHAKLVADASGRSVSNEIKKYINTDEYNNKTTRYLPGDLTIFDQVYYLIPNNYLDMKACNTKRFWPRGEIYSTGFSELEELTYEYFASFVGYLRTTNYLVYYGLTGGVDTRILISASKHFNFDFKTLTWDYKSLSLLEKDAINGISNYLGFENLWLNYRDKTKSNFNFLDEVGNINSGLLRSASDLVHKTFVAVPNNSMFVRGLGGEILRGSYNKSMHMYRDLSTLNYFVRVYSGANNKHYSKFYEDFTVKAFSDFLIRGNYNQTYNCDVGDLFYWEHRMAIWAANLQNEYDVALKNLVGINSRRLFEVSYGLPKEIRFRRQLLTDLMLQFDEYLSRYKIV